MTRGGGLARIALVPLVAALGCSKADETAACTRDQQTLRALIDEDQRVGALLHKADSLATAGQGADAAAHIEREARPEADKVVAHVAAFHPSSRWGATAQRDLHDLVSKRRTTMDAYANALRSDDLAAVVREMEAQRELEMRALALQKRLASTPEAKTGDCVAP